MEVPSDHSIDQDTQGEAKQGLYNRFFLKNDLQEVRIYLPEENLKYLLDNAADKVSVLTDKVIIGDETVKYTGLKTKGDYTLAHGVSDNHSNRYSFTINFGKYVKKANFGHKQNFFGLRKLSFNNFYFDKSMLKEYTAYYLLGEMRLPASQYGLAKLYINDKYYGVYFMVEAFDHSILEQYYNKDKKELGRFLTKPDRTDLEYNDIIRNTSLLWNNDEEIYEDIKDDVPMVTESLRKLNNLSNGRDFEGNPINVNSSEYIELLEKVVELDEVIRYFAVHSFLVQTDNMFTVQHNYGLYCDPEGKLVIIPWDYDLSYGTYYPSSADNTANYDIDIMYCMYESWQDYNNDEHNAEVYSEFPLFNVIYNNKELMDRYHDYMLDCSKIMALGGTTTDGRTYEPANMYGIIEKISGKLIEAATVKTAPGSSYMNRINQPLDVKKGIPNLEKIIARRAVGVYLQLKGERSWVTGTGCDLSAVGNGMRASGKKSGRLTAVDESTGIFVTAEYQNGAPQLNVKILDRESDEYISYISSLGENESGSLKNAEVYRLSDTGNVKSGYKVSIPMKNNSEDLESDEKNRTITVYTVDENGLLEQVGYDKDDNLIIFETSSLNDIVIVEKEQEEPVKIYVDGGNRSTESNGNSNANSDMDGDARSDVSNNLNRDANEGNNNEKNNGTDNRINNGPNNSSGVNENADMFRNALFVGGIAFAELLLFMLFLKIKDKFGKKHKKQEDDQGDQPGEAPDDNMAK
ncbi:MAG: CotH kinase family protein [Lachnospiraceae bacterium]|nr:CotH kinase family protein [Lachnospiraceae bacterium]